MHPWLLCPSHAVLKRCLPPAHLPLRVVLFLGGADSSACVVGLDRGEPIGRAMKPKNASRPLAMALLDAAGCPLPQLHGGLVLHWANNNSTATVRSLAMTKVASIREEAGQASSRSLGRLRWGQRGVLGCCPCQEHRL